MLGIAQLPPEGSLWSSIAGMLVLPFVPAATEDIARWKRSIDSVFSDLADRFLALAKGTSIADLTVLSIEPVARSQSSGFGWRDDPIRHTRRFHSGTDFRGKPGAPVVAAGNGTVVFCGRLGGYGNAIDIDHGGGVLTRYAHLRRIETKKGAEIAAGAMIGRVGSTGRTTGPHLHFEVRINGAPVSPIAAMSVAALQREFPLAGRLAALSLSPERQAATESKVDPPKHHAKPAQRPERSGAEAEPLGSVTRGRPGREKRRQVLW
jgi:murein DD-endopeptidase MepM/ murein hydrolase activator NlpD